MKKYIIFLVASITLTTVQCKKSTPEEQLPPITTSGANTFGCLVNGNLWLPNGEWNINALTVPTIGNGKNLELDITTSYRKNDTWSDIFIDVAGLIPDTSTYKIYNSLSRGLSYYDSTGGYEPYDTFGIVHIIRCDTIQKIISGTFSFIGYTNIDHTQSVNITDGRFDLHYPLTIH